MSGQRAVSIAEHRKKKTQVRKEKRIVETPRKGLWQGVQPALRKDAPAKRRQGTLLGDERAQLEEDPYNKRE